MREVFHSENHSGYSSPLLETSLKRSNTPLYRVPARFHQKSVILSGPGALQLRFLDRNLTASATTRAHSLPDRGGTCSWIAIFTSCNQAVVVFPVSLSSLPTTSSKTRSPLQCFQTFGNHLEHLFQDLYILVAHSLGPSSTSHSNSQTLFRGPC